MWSVQCQSMLEHAQLLLQARLQERCLAFGRSGRPSSSSVPYHVGPIGRVPSRSPPVEPTVRRSPFAVGRCGGSTPGAGVGPFLWHHDPSLPLWSPWSGSSSDSPLSHPSPLLPPQSPSPKPRPRGGKAVSFTLRVKMCGRIPPPSLTPQVVDPSAEMIRATELLTGVLGAQGIDAESLIEQFRPPPALVVPTFSSRRELALELDEQ